MVASEAAPYAKTGGLADVLGALPAALAAGGDQVGVVLPYYRSAAAKAQHSQPVYDRMELWFSPTRSYHVGIRRLDDRGVSFFFVDAPQFFDRPALYGEVNGDYPDNAIRFAVLCRAALGVVRSLFRPDIIHCHDWQAGLVAPYMKTVFRGDPTFAGIRNVMTVHNLGYQGIYGREVLAEIGLPREMYNPARMEFWGNLSYLKAGIVYADALTTVSQGYAREIQTPEYGFGMDGLLRSCADVLTGIVNGVDYSEWNPETDPFTAARFSASDLSGKVACKADLLRTFGLPDDAAVLERPLIGIVSRFASQKGFDLIEEVAVPLMEQREVSLVVLGTGELRYEEMLRALAVRYPARVSVRAEFNNAVAHKVEAGSDMFLMPSRYEPCGLNQIYSLRYGTVPVVRATGGLDDTIDESTGFKFAKYSASALFRALNAALDAFPDRERWTQMMKNGMSRDHSWGSAAAEYGALYRSLIAD